MLRLFPNRVASQMFVILLMAMSLVMGSVVFIYDAYLREAQDVNSPRQLAEHVEHLVDMSHKLTPDELLLVIKDFHYQGVSTRLVRASDSVKVKAKAPLSMKDIREEVLANPKHFFVRLPVGSQHWLEINTHFIYPIGFIVQLMLVLSCLIAVVVLLCAWVVRRLTWPIAQFAHAAQRFAIDVDAPPMPVGGLPSEQEAAQAFNQMQRRIRQLLNDRTQMLAAISHDLRTPITRLKLRAESLEGIVREKIQSDLNDMEQMINSILIFARDEVRSEKSTRFDLVALMESICNDMSDTGRDVTFSTVVPRVIFTGRLTALKRALTNLLDNALKYGDKAEVQLAMTEQHIIVKIQDQGPGIPREDLEKVFLPFYRVDHARSAQTRGSGLGLAVSQDIIRAHSGSIDLVNCQPKGLLAMVNLPLCA